MQEKITLSSATIQSIHCFFFMKNTANSIKWDGLFTNTDMFYKKLLPLLSDWYNYIQFNEIDIWNTLKPLKNNFHFTLLLLEQFKKEATKQLILPQRLLLKKGDKKKEELNRYLQYAQELHFEAYGVPFNEREYSKKELFDIIKKCEMNIFLSQTNLQPPKVVPLFS